jgi:hypothetical protein
MASNWIVFQNAAPDTRVATPFADALYKLASVLGRKIHLYQFLSELLYVPRCTVSKHQLHLTLPDQPPPRIRVQPEMFPPDMLLVGQTFAMGTLKTRALLDANQLNCESQASRRDLHHGPACRDVGGVIGDSREAA